MPVRLYPWEEAFQRIYRRLRGDTISANVEEIDGSVTLNEALSGIAEILQGSSTDTLHTFVHTQFHPVSSAPTGTLPGDLGGFLYSINGGLYWYGASGTVTTIAGS